MADYPQNSQGNSSRPSLHLDITPSTSRQGTAAVTPISANIISPPTRDKHASSSRAAAVRSPLSNSNAAFDGAGSGSVVSPPSRSRYPPTMSGSSASISPHTSTGPISANSGPPDDSYGAVPPPSPKRKRSRVNPEQLARLEELFSTDRSPTASRRREISAELGMHDRQTQIWFQNRRAKAKVQEGRGKPRAKKSAASAAAAELARQNQTQTSGSRSRNSAAASSVEQEHSSDPDGDGDDGGEDDYEDSPPVPPGASPSLESLARRFRESGQIIQIPCSSLRIGSWRTITDARQGRELFAYIAERQRGATPMLVWFLSYSNHSYKMELPVDGVESTYLTFDPSDSSQAKVELRLSRTPDFFADATAMGPSAAGAGAPSSRARGGGIVWQPCADFTQGGSIGGAVVHEMRGPAQGMLEVVSRLPGYRQDVRPQGPIPQSNLVYPTSHLVPTNATPSHAAVPIPMHLHGSVSVPHLPAQGMYASAGHHRHQQAYVLQHQQEQSASYPMSSLDRSLYPGSFPRGDVRSSTIPGQLMYPEQQTVQTTFAYDQSQPRGPNDFTPPVAFSAPGTNPTLRSHHHSPPIVPHGTAHPFVDGMLANSFHSDHSSSYGSLAEEQSADGEGHHFAEPLSYDDQHAPLLPPDYLQHQQHLPSQQYSVGRGRRSQSGTFIPEASFESYSMPDSEHALGDNIDYHVAFGAQPVSQPAVFASAAYSFEHKSVTPHDGALGSFGHTNEDNGRAS